MMAKSTMSLIAGAAQCRFHLRCATDRATCTAKCQMSSASRLGDTRTRHSPSSAFVLAPATQSTVVALVSATECQKRLLRACMTFRCRMQSELTRNPCGWYHRTPSHTSAAGGGTRQSRWPHSSRMQCHARVPLRPLQPRSRSMDSFRFCWR